MAQPVYLDYNATTPTDPRVVEAMARYALVDFGNPSSQHIHGRTARLAVEEARSKVASLLGVQPDEMVFTSGATESNNLVLMGLASHGRRAGRTHILASSIEHASVLGPLEMLARDGYSVELLPVGADGYVDPIEVRARIRSDTLLVSIMHANNETGVLQPVLEIARWLPSQTPFSTSMPHRPSASRFKSSRACNTTFSRSAGTRSSGRRALVHYS